MNLKLNERYVQKLCIIFGIWPRYQYNRNEKLYVSYDKLESIATITALIIFSIYTMYDIATNHKNYTVLSGTGNTEVTNQLIETVLANLALILIYIVSAINYMDYLKIINQFDQYDEKLNKKFKFKIKLINVKPILNVVYFIGTVSNTAISIFYICSSNMFLKPKIILGATYTLQFFIGTSHSLQFHVNLMKLRERFKFLNYNLIVYNHNWKEFHDLLELQINYRNILEIINNTNGSIIFVYMGYAFYTITNQGYLVFASINTDLLIEQKIRMISLSFIWIGVQYFIITIYCWSASAIAEEVDKTTQILSRYYGKEKNMKIIIDNFLTKSIKQKTEITAYDFFTINISTIFKISSAVATYLVILIQFRQLEESETGTVTQPSIE